MWCIYVLDLMNAAQLLISSTDDIEMRVCRDEGRDNEDIAIETVEIYVQ